MDIDLAPLQATPPYSAAALAALTAQARALRSAAQSPSAQSLLVRAGAPALLAQLLTSEALRSPPTDATPLFRRVAWQALANLCAGQPASQAAVWEAILAPSGSEGRGACALECGATAAGSDSALASVVLGVAYTAGGSACYGGEGGSGGQGGEACAARLQRLCQHPVLLPTLLRPCLPALGEGAGGGAGEGAGDVGLWCQLLAGALLQCALFEPALRAASRGLAAGELLAASASPAPQQRPWRVTAESTALVCAAEAELEGAKAPHMKRLSPGLTAALPALGHFLSEACMQALAMAALLLPSGASSSGSSTESAAVGAMDSGPLLLLPRLQLGLCLRAAEAAAGLLADAFSALEACREAEAGGAGEGAGERGGAAAAGGVEACTEPGEVGLLPPGAVTALLALLAAATPLISMASAQPAPDCDIADAAGGGASASASASAPPPPFPAHPAPPPPPPPPLP